MEPAQTSGMLLCRIIWRQNPIQVRLMVKAGIHFKVMIQKLKLLGEVDEIWLYRHSERKKYIYFEKKFFYIFKSVKFQK